jgi:ribulose-bisphosphate carboxylase large chain
MQMKTLDWDSLKLLWHDADAREVSIREIVTDRLAERPPPCLDDQIVASYFFAFRTMKLKDAVAEISYHATSGIKHPPPGSLLHQCTARAAGIDEFDGSGRLGLLHMAFPLKMLLQPDGHLTSCDLLHTLAGAIIFDVYENQDAKLVDIQIPEAVLRTFPGPAYGPEGVRARRTGQAASLPAFGTILKPTAGITPDQVGELVEEAASSPLFVFIKEDENLYPNLDYSPAAERTRRAVDALERTRSQTGFTPIFAPHITGSPHEILETVHAVVEAGASGVMFSETFAGGTVRMVREATRSLPRRPAIYGHNAGIGVKTRAIWREIIDLLARLDGIDFRQTAPVRMGPPFIRPYGAEWRASEQALARPLPGIRPTMIARAGGLDQGNIIPNLADAEKRGLDSSILFLAGSAINSIKNARGKPDPRLGAEAMYQALDVHRSGELSDVPLEDHVRALAALAERKRLAALGEALRQRYPGLAS